MTWIPRALGDLCDPARTALLVYDMQVGICGQVEGAGAIVEGCRLTIAAARASGMRVAYTRHLSAPRPWMGTTQLRTAMAWQRRSDTDAVKPWFPRGATASQIMPAIAPEADDLVVDKLAISAFEGTPLAFALRDCGLTGIAICGIATEIGIEPTVRHATDLGFVPILIEDACGSGNQAAGAAAVRAVRFIGEALMTDVTEFSRLLPARGDRR